MIRTPFPYDHRIGIVWLPYGGATPEMLIEDQDALAFAIVMTARRAVGVDQ